MHAVLNHLQFSDVVDPGLFAAAETDLLQQMRAVDGFHSFYVVQTSPTEVTLVILAIDADALDRIAAEVGSPWMRANVVPLLAAPPDRRVGPVLASS